ncbi:MAG: DsbA family protein [Pseudomonadota bacterium]
MMTFRPFLLAGTALLAACGASVPPDAEATTTAAAQSMSDEEFDQRLREALMRNPELIIAAIEAYRDQLEANAAAATEDAVKAALPDLVAAKNGNAFGARADKAELVIIEFFDYHCGFCRRAVDEVLTVMDEKKNVRVVFNELPILREESRLAARTALAAAQVSAENYRKAHLAMMRHGGLLDSETIDRVLKSGGVNVKATNRAMETDRAEIDKKLSGSIEDGQTLGIGGTPFFIVYNPKNETIRILEGFQPGSINQAVAEVLGS